MKKNDRFIKTKVFLRMQSSFVTVSEIHEALTKRMGVVVCRKTVERDMIEMVELGLVSQSPGIPARFTYNQASTKY